MMVFWPQKLVFLAVPKTGTTAIEKALGNRADIVATNPPQVKHATVRKFNRFWRPYLVSVGFEDFETMAVIREPVDWLGSWYRYRRRDALIGKPNSTANISFDAFVEAYMRHKDRPSFAKVGAQGQFLADAKGNCGVDHLFAYEDFDRIGAFLAEKFGKPIPLTRSNVSPKLNISLSDTVRAKLMVSLQTDFDLHAMAGNL